MRCTKTQRRLIFGDKVHLNGHELHVMFTWLLILQPHVGTSVLVLEYATNSSCGFIVELIRYAQHLALTMVLRL